MTADTLVEARWVIPVIPRNTVLENHTVVFSGGRIADILPTEAARVRYAGLEAKTMRLPAGVVMPGLINLHTHAAMNLLRGRGADLPLMDWLTKEIWPAEGRLMSAEFVHDGSLIAGVEMIRSGVTCCSDLYFFPEAAAEGLREAGLRCATAGIVIGFPSAWAANDDEYISKCEALIERYSGDPFVRVTVGPHAPYTVSDASLARCAALSERHDLPVHIHVNETAGEVETSLKDHGERPVARLARLGLLNERLISVHSVHTSNEDIRMLAEARASVCHCPSSNLKLASGFAPVAKMMKAGINLGIGTDGAASNDKLDMLEAATLGGARALHWDDEIGSLEIGKCADMIAVDLSGIECGPVTDPAAQLLYSAGREHVTHVWVAGRLAAGEGTEPRDDTARTLLEKWAPLI